MSFVAVAIGGSALIGGITSVIAGNKAAGAQKDAAAQSDATNRYIYDTTRADYAPYRSVGYGALGKLASMYGVTPTNADGSPATGASGGGTPGGGTNWTAYLQSNPDVAQAYNGVDRTQFPTPESYAQWHYQNYGQNEGRTAPTASSSAQPYGGFQTSPGYQFRVDEATKAIERSAAARGALRSGATMDALQRRVQGVASSEYENYANRLAALAGVGQTATGSVAQAGQNYAQQQTATNTAAGNATASAYQNTGNAINGTVGNLASMYLYSKGYGGGFGGAPALPPATPMINNYGYG